jgi:hypothetical protein
MYSHEFTSSAIMPDDIWQTGVTQVSLLLDPSPGATSNIRSGIPTWPVNQHPRQKSAHGRAPAYL